MERGTLRKLNYARAAGTSPRVAALGGISLYG